MLFEAVMDLDYRDNFWVAYKEVGWEKYRQKKILFMRLNGDPENRVYRYAARVREQSGVMACLISGRPRPRSHRRRTLFGHKIDDQFGWLRISSGNRDAAEEGSR